MQEPTFTVPVSVVADIVMLNDDIGYLIETGFADEAVEELTDTQQRLAALLDKLEAGRNTREGIS